jgi:hypothetical protein
VSSAADDVSAPAIVRADTQIAIPVCITFVFMMIIGEI